MKDILKNHGIITKEESGQLFALESGTMRDENDNVFFYGEWVDVTGWGLNQISRWLGY